MEIDELFPVAETLQMLRFAEVEGGDIKLTDTGNAFADAELDERKQIFSRATAQPTCRSPRISAGCSTSAPSTWRRKRRFSDELEDYMSEEAAEQTLRAIISLARYAEVFAYDNAHSVFSLENPN